MRKLALIGLIGALLVPTVAYAASFALASDELGSGDTAVSGCDSAFTFAYTTSQGNVTTVAVGDVADPACEGGTLDLTLVDSSGASIGAGTAAVGTDGDSSPNTVNVSLSPQPAASAVAGVQLVIVGP